MKQPSLFCDLGESVSTPDGMALDKNGNLFLSVPNFFKYERYGSKICKFDSLNKAITWFDSLPRHPETLRVHPMGMEFASDGNLYIADNQFFFDKNYKSRLLRIVVVNGKPVKAEVVADGFKLANAVRVKGSRIYVSDTEYSLKDKKKQSAIFSFDLEEFKKGTVHIKSGEMDAHIFYFADESGSQVRTDGGFDGMTFDKKGNLYAGSFGNGNIYKFGLTKKGLLKSTEIIIDSAKLGCCDGMFYCKKTNTIYLTNFKNNSVHALDLDKQELRIVWENQDDDGAGGLLDQPCEPIIYKEKLLIVNFDTFVNGKNTKADDKHTISMFSLW
ncbi:MAG: SMP-30/gluconolactonase/LRE family protein [Bacteroidia bacterium]|nr:SMP-30/gluconolactonase/LRE family protein [Bacteroidia bacterium]